MIDSVLLVVAGATLLVVAFVDMLWTTVAVSAGGGPVTARVAAWLWSGARHLASRKRQVAHRRLRLASLMIVLVVFSMWLVLAWAGWTLILLAHPDAVVSATTLQPASGSERGYFAGYTMATLGNGEFIPQGTVWRAVTVLATMSGFGLATMGITYLVPVVGAVTDRRAQALHISSLGQTPEEIVVQAWERGRWRSLEHELQQIGPALSLLGQRHLAYPILHYFHDVDRAAAAAVRIAVLDEAVTLLDSGVAPDSRPDGSVIDGVRRSIDAYLGALRAAFISPADRDPLPPRLGVLRAAGIPTVDDTSFREAIRDLSERRRTLLGAVADDGWSWDDVTGRGAEQEEESRQAIEVQEFEDHGGSDAA